MIIVIIHEFPLSVEVIACIQVSVAAKPEPLDYTGENLINLQGANEIEIETSFKRPDSA